MPRKKSIKKACGEFRTDAEAIKRFAVECSTDQGDEHQSWIYEQAAIRLYRSFENLMLAAIVGAVNNDTTTISATIGVDFPKHLTDEVCEYLIVGTGYFNFQGRDGLIQVLKRFLPKDHYLTKCVSHRKYTTSIDKLIALRNYATHGSKRAKERAKAVTKSRRLRSSGAWLKRHDRLSSLATSLENLASDLESSAPY